MILLRVGFRRDGRSGSYFLGEHDFTFLRGLYRFGRRRPRPDNGATVYSSEICVRSETPFPRCRGGVDLRGSGKSFMRYMVRKMVGTMIEVGGEKIESRRTFRRFSRCAIARNRVRRCRRRALPRERGVSGSGQFAGSILGLRSWRFEPRTAMFQVRLVCTGSVRVR